MVPFDTDRLVVIDGEKYFLVDIDLFVGAVKDGAPKVRKSEFRVEAGLKELILQIIEKTPGLDKQDIINALDELGEKPTRSQTDHAVANLRRGNHITNKGTRKQPKWFLT